MNKSKAISLVVEELDRATSLYVPFHSGYEGYAVILEELDELWDDVRMAKSFQDRRAGYKREATQVAAMALRFLVDLVDDEL